MTNEIKYLSLDPGDTTGWATFDSDGEVILFGQLAGREKVYEFLPTMPKKITIIAENYLIYPNKALAHTWSPVETLRILGVIEFFSHINESPLIEQPANIKGIAYMWAGIKPAKNHDVSHQLDAYVHGVYYLQRMGVRRPQQARRN